jgi:hypothetical protein
MDTKKTDFKRCVAGINDQPIVFEEEMARLRHFGVPNKRSPIEEPAGLSVM